MNKILRWYILGAIIAIIAVAVVTTHHTNNMSSTTGNMSTSAVNTSSVKIQNYMFSPMSIRVKVGTTVTWTNEDQAHHSVTADTISSVTPNGPLIGQGQTYSFTFTTAGTYNFHCMPHPYMHGTVIVTN